jgi:hypothetical protein
MDEGLPVVREGRGKLLARGSSLIEGKTHKENANFIRSVLKTETKIRIGSRLY